MDSRTQQNNPTLHSEFTCSINTQDLRLKITSPSKVRIEEAVKKMFPSSNIQPSQQDQSTNLVLDSNGQPIGTMRENKTLGAWQHQKAA
jgi:hypothetical protein